MKITPELLTKAYTRGIQSALKGLATDGSDLHENYTPPVICDMMLDKLDLTQTKSILVLYNLELLFALRLRKYTGPVTFFTQSPTKAEIAPKFLPGVAVEYIDKEENPLYFMENKWPDKFDIVVANPPYSNKLDIKFLEKSLEICKEKTIFVHPSSFLIDRKKATRIFSNLRLSYRDYLESITFFNGNGIFNIELQVPCSITVFNKRLKNKIFSFNSFIHDQNILLESEKIEDLSIFGYSKEFLSIEKKIKNFLKDGSHDIQSICSFSGELKDPNSYFIEFSPIMGRANKGSNLSKSDNLYKKDFFVAISKNQLQVKHLSTPKYGVIFEFDSERKATNFLAYMQTSFFRMCLALTKTNPNLHRGEFKMIPLIDFNQEWNDEKLFSHFNITEEEQAFIKEIIPPYYD